MLIWQAGPCHTGIQNSETRQRYTGVQRQYARGRQRPDGVGQTRSSGRPGRACGPKWSRGSHRPAGCPAPAGGMLSPRRRMVRTCVPGGLHHLAEGVAPADRTSGTNRRDLLHQPAGYGAPGDRRQRTWWPGAAHDPNGRCTPCGRQRRTALADESHRMNGAHTPIGRTGCTDPPMGLHQYAGGVAPCRRTECSRYGAMRASPSAWMHRTAEGRGPGLAGISMEPWGRRHAVDGWPSHIN